MTYIRQARLGAIALTSAATLVLLASCVSGVTDTQDGPGASGGVPSVGTTGGAQATGTGGVGPTTGGVNSPAGGFVSSTGGTVSSGNGGGSPGGSNGTNTGGNSSDGGSGTQSGGSSNGGGSNSNCSDLPPNNGDTCAHAVEYGWCTQDWLGMSCLRSCGKCNGTTNTGGSGSGAGGSKSTGGASGNSGGTAGSNGGSKSTGGTSTGGTGTVVQPPPITNGQNAWASRYWDCCKPACGWKANVRSGNPMNSCSKDNQVLGGADTKNACEGGGSAFMCWSGAPWSVSDTLSYGFAAASGPNYVCGRCFQVQFTGSGHNGNNPGAQSLNGKTMIIQVINNGGVAQDQFDILIPGGGVGALNACSNQWGTSDLGAQYGGFLAGCNGDKNCVKNKCMTVFSGKPELQAGCDWFLGWYNAADNPNFIYKQIACPAALTQRSGLSDPG